MSTGSAYQCAQCSSTKNKVISSRKKSMAIWRRRECLECKHRWTTYEVAEQLLASLEDKAYVQEN